MELEEVAIDSIVERIINQVRNEDETYEDGEVHIISKIVDDYLRNNLRNVLEMVLNSDLTGEHFIKKEEFNPDKYHFIKKDLGTGGISYDDSIADGDGIFYSPRIKTKDLILSKNLIFEDVDENNRIDYRKVITKINGQESTSLNGSVTLNISQLEETDYIKHNALVPDINGRINANSTDSNSGNNSIMFGKNSLSRGIDSIAIGFNAKAEGDKSVQIGEGVNNEVNTLKFRNYEIIKEDGTIPQERIVDQYMEKLVEINWDITSGNVSEMLVTVEGMTEDALVWVSPAPVNNDNYNTYVNSGMRAIGQGEDFLMFKVDSTPENSTIYVNVVWRKYRDVINYDN